jgi:hypothetical protein
VIEKVTHGSMGRRWSGMASMVARSTRRLETAGLRSLAYGPATWMSALPYTRVGFPRFDGHLIQAAIGCRPV